MISPCYRFCLRFVVLMCPSRWPFHGGHQRKHAVNLLVGIEDMKREAKHTSTDGVSDGGVFETLWNRPEPGIIRNLVATATQATNSDDVRGPVVRSQPGDL